MPIEPRLDPSPLVQSDGLCDRCPRRTVHVHRRDDWRPCPAVMPPPMVPSKPAAIWHFRFAEALLHEETYRAFQRVERGIDDLIDEVAAAADDAFDAGRQIAPGPDL